MFIVCLFDHMVLTMVVQYKMQLIKTTYLYNDLKCNSKWVESYILLKKDVVLRAHSQR